MRRNMTALMEIRGESFVDPASRRKSEPRILAVFPSDGGSRGSVTSRGSSMGDGTLEYNVIQRVDDPEYEDVA